MSAQVKKGSTIPLDNLQDYLLQIIILPQNRILKPIKLTYYNFIQNINELLNQYVRSKNNITFNLFLIDYYVRKYSKCSQLYRNFFGLIHSWKRYIDNQDDAKLLLQLLTDDRNNKQYIKKFIKIRKIILKNTNIKILSQIFITHSDSITITHMLFEGNNRNIVIQKINQLFICLKKKLINTAKINGAIACQFFMNIYEELCQSKLLKINQNVQQIQQKQNYINCQLSFSQEYAGGWGYKQKKGEQWRNQSYDSRSESQSDSINEEQTQGNRQIFKELSQKQSFLKMKNKPIFTDPDDRPDGYPSKLDQLVRNNKKKQRIKIYE